MVELAAEQVAALAAALRPHFYVDEDVLRDAVLHHTCCNVLHRGTAFKVDLFARRDRTFSRSEMARRIFVEVAGMQLPVATAEDCVLTKLEWFEKGGQVSDRQWRDVLGILKAQASRLDMVYLRRWAGELCLSDVLQRALAEAGVPR